MNPSRDDAQHVHAFGLCTKRCDHQESDAAQIAICRAWIRRWAYRRKSINTRRGSYGLKHEVEESTRALGVDFYVTNGAFIVAALLEGYTVVPCSAGSLNAFFNMGFRKEPLPVVEVAA